MRRQVVWRTRPSHWGCLHTALAQSKCQLSARMSPELPRCTQVSHGSTFHAEGSAWCLRGWAPSCRAAHRCRMAPHRRVGPPGPRAWCSGCGRCRLMPHGTAGRATTHFRTQMHFQPGEAACPLEAPPPPSQLQQATRVLGPPTWAHQRSPAPRHVARPDAGRAAGRAGERPELGYSRSR